MTQGPGPAGMPAGRAAGRQAGRVAGAVSDEDTTRTFAPVPDEPPVAEPAPPEAAAADPAAGPDGAAAPARGKRSARPTYSFQDPPPRRSVPPAPSAAPSGAAVLTTPIRDRAVRRGAPRRARLTLTRVDPWSVLKAALVFSTCLLVVWMIAVIILYGILTGAGVFNSINNNLNDALGTKIDFNGAYILGGALILGAFNVVLTSALATVGAFAYNVTVSLVGGVDVTLAERE